MNYKKFCLIFLYFFLVIIFIAINTYALSGKDRDQALPHKTEIIPSKSLINSEKEIKYPSSQEISSWLEDSRTFPVNSFDPLNIQKLNRDNFKPPANRTSTSAHKTLITSIDYLSALSNGAKRLIRLQADITEDNAANGALDVDLEDGGWDWQIDSTITSHSGSASPTNIYGATAGGVLGAYVVLSGKPYPPALSTWTALEDVYTGTLADPTIDSGGDFPFLVKLSEKTGDSKYANLAKSRYDAKKTYYGSAKAWAVAIVNGRGVNGDGVIPWDINLLAVGASKLNDYFPGQGYDADADTFAQVIYEDIYNNNPGYFDETNQSEWWWTMGIAGTLEAFTVSGTHPTERDQLATTLLNYQNDGVSKTPKGAWDWSDDYTGGDYQTTAYAIMALMAYGGTQAKSACIDGVNWLVSEQRANGNWYWDGWYEFPEEEGEVLWAISLLVPAEVWVDDNYNSSTPGWEYDHFDKIQDGIAAVAYGGKVNVASGTYNVVQIRIGKAVSLLGAGSATTIIDGGKSDLNSYGDGTVLITSSATGTIMIDGFTLQNPGYTGTVPDDWILTMVDYINTATVTVQNCHFVGYGPSDPDHWDYAFYVVKNNGGTVTVQNNEFEQMWAAVLIELPEGPVKILNNNIHHLQSQIYPPEPPPIGPVYSAYGVFATTYGGLDVPHLQQVNGNTFSDYAGRCIHFVGGYPDVPEVNKFTNVEIKNNTIKAIGTGPENQHAGIILANAGTTPAEAAQGGVDNAIISGNKVKGSGGTDSYGLRLRGPNNNANIQDNAIIGVNKGIAVEEWYTGAGTATGLVIYDNILMCNTNNATDNGSSNTWDNGVNKGNFWDDFSSNSGFPSQYNVPGTALSIDHYPQAPSVVWVDDDWAGTPCGDSVGGHLFGYDAFATIQDGVNGVTLAGTVNVAPGTYEEQVVITKSNLTITGAGAGPDPATHTIVKSPVALTWFFTTSANNYPVMGINGATGVQIKNLRVDGAGRGNSNYRFVGVGFWNGDGSVIDCEITGVRDTPFSGAQHGNGIYSYNNAGGPYTINVSGTEIDDFQKNGMTLSGNNLTVNVLNCTVMGKGLTSVTAQNGIQIGYGAGGTVTNCSVSDIGYIPATWVASGMIFLNGTIVNVSGTSSVSGSQVSIVFQETQGSVDGVNITSADIDAAEGISIRDYGYSRFKGNPGKISAISLSPFEEEWEVESKLLSIPTTVTINNATLTGVHHVGSYGVATWSLGDDVNLTLTNSDIQDWEIGVVAYESGSKVNVTANHNTISSNDMGFWTNAALIQNAVSNWWGDASGPYHSATNAGAMGNEVTDYVDYSPWWGANYVGDSHATPWTWYVNTSNNSTIQEGIDLASSGDVVRARPGTYNENININKPLALLGVGQDSVLVYPAISDIGQPNPELGPSFRGSQICVVQASNVTIDGFTFDGDSPTLTPLGTLDARNGIITNYSLGDWSNLKVQNCTVKNIYLRGIYASAKNPNNLTGVDFNHNTISNVKGVSMQSAGLMLWGSSGNVKHNDVSDASLGIFYHWYSDGNIDSNTVTSSEVCLGTNSNDAATSISYNTVTNSAQGIQTVYILAPVNVVFNNVTACTSGVVLYGGGSAQNNVWDNNIIGLGYYSTYGFWGSTDPYGALSANMKRNTIKDNFYGMVLNEAHGNNAALLSVLIGGAPADHNFIYDNINYELLLEYCNDNQTATYNYWGKALYTQIEEEIYHKVDQPDLGLVTFDPAILLGDVNLDGQVSVSDIVYLINYLFKGGPAPQIFIVADVNGDGKVSVSDVIYLINYLFKGGSAPIALSSGSSSPVMVKSLIDKPKATKPLNLHPVEK
jgi:hypothetical protein